VCVCVLCARALACVLARLLAATGKTVTSGYTTTPLLPELLGCTSSIVIQRNACTNTLADAGPAHSANTASQTDSCTRLYTPSCHWLAFWRSENSCLCAVSWFIWIRRTSRPCVLIIIE